jgi:two-component system, OmpR family, alkaline phosphatase synthesis response regulator PhoP
MTATAVDVLVIDDNEDLLDLTTRALRRAGFTVAAASDLAALDRTLETSLPRLILMDVQMPELFGDEVAATLRHERGLKAKVVLHSSIDSDYLERLATDAGLDGWISKSAGLGHLVARVRELLGSQPTTP